MLQEIGRQNYKIDEKRIDLFEKRYHRHLPFSHKKLLDSIVLWFKKHIWGSGKWDESDVYLLLKVLICFQTRYTVENWLIVSTQNLKCVRQAMQWWQSSGFHK